MNENNLIKIKISVHEGLKFIIFRQTPLENGIWNNCQFIVNDDVGVFDWWVVR